MFTLRKKQPSIQLAKLSSLIAEDVVITGDVSFASGLRIDGRLTKADAAPAVDNVVELAADKTVVNAERR